MTVFEKIIYNENQLRTKIISALTDKLGIIVTYFNVHCFYQYSKNNLYRELIDKKQFNVYPDGTGMWFLLKKLGLEYNRFNATDLNTYLLKYFIAKKSSILIIGGNYDKNVIEQYSKKHRINLMDYINGFLANDQIIKITNNMTPDVILIGTGIIKQERLAYQLSKNHPNAVIICIGNFLNFYFKFQKRAPLFFRKLGLEWLFRFYLEPRRLFKRYTLEILFFIKEYFKIKI